MTGNIITTPVQGNSEANIVSAGNTIQGSNVCAPDGQLVVAIVSADSGYVPPNGADGLGSSVVHLTHDTELPYVPIKFTVQNPSWEGNEIFVKFMVGDESRPLNFPYIVPPEFKQILNSGLNLLPSDLSAFAIESTVSPNYYFDGCVYALDGFSVVIEVGEKDGENFVRKIIEPDDSRYIKAIGLNCAAGTGLNGRHIPTLAGVDGPVQG